MKRILFLTFYFEPDLCAGSFRNTPLVKELAVQCSHMAEIDVVTTMPNRYGTYRANAPSYEERDNIVIHRIELPPHSSGMKDQIFSFKKYYADALKLTKGKRYDLVVASSSRLFTAYLGYKIASRYNSPLYLDVRDIFYDTIEDILKNPFVKMGVLPVLKYVEKKTFTYAAHINLISSGFESYFKQYRHANYSFFTNGIDEIFSKNNASERYNIHRPMRIVYAGNLGEGQGLDKIIPDAAKKLGEDYKFIIIGDGGTKDRLVQKIKEYNLSNVELVKPVRRDELIKIYESCDYTFVHLNDYKAFEKVLPSKIFELATFPQPIIAGVSGYAAKFIREKVDNSIIFEPCNIDDFLIQFKNFEYKRVKRTEFVSKYKRNTINESLSSSIVNYL